jgi:hypothetical protein
MEYKSPYLTGDVRPNLIILALYNFLNTPLYENSRITIHPCWLDMFTLSMQTNTNIFYDVDDDESCDHNNENRFEEEQEDILIDTMVQNILSYEQIYNYFENAITMALGQDFKPLGLFQDLHCEELNSPTLFFGQPHSNQGINMSYQMIIQLELLHKNHNFATHVPINFFKAIKVLIHFVISSSWVHIRKRKFLGCQFQACDVINKPNLDVIGLCIPLDYLS